MARKKDTLLAFLVGAAVGSVAALLLAPESGEVTRRRLREGGGKMVGKGKDALGRAASAIEEGAREKGHAMGEAARQQVGAVRGAVAEAKDTYRREIDKG
jgi:gas vesicle protein